MVPKWDTPLGGPPKAPEAPPGAPGCPRDLEKNCKNSQNLYKKLTCIKIPSFVTLTPTFGNLGHWGGPWGVKMVFGPVQVVKLELEA